MTLQARGGEARPCLRVAGGDLIGPFLPCCCCQGSIHSNPPWRHKRFIPIVVRSRTVHVLVLGFGSGLLFIHMHLHPAFQESFYSSSHRRGASACPAHDPLRIKDRQLINKERMRPVTCEAEPGWQQGPHAHLWWPFMMARLMAEVPRAEPHGVAALFVCLWCLFAQHTETGRWHRSQVFVCCALPMMILKSFFARLTAPD